MSWPRADGYGALVERFAHESRRLPPLPTGQRARLQPLPGVSALIVDVYGTVLVSAAGEPAVTAEPRRVAHLRAALAAAGLGRRADGFARAVLRLLQHAITAAHARMQARGVAHPEIDIRAIWRRVLGGLGLPASSAAAARLAVEFEVRVNPCSAMPRAAATLRQLHESGRPLGIASNAQFFTPPLVDALLGLRQGRPCVAPELCAWSWTLGEAKPSPRLLRQVLKALHARHGIAAGQTAMVGNDMLNDLLPAWQCGCRTILFAGDRRSLRLRAEDPRCAVFRPDAVVTDWGQVPVLLPG